MVGLAAGESWSFEGRWEVGQPSIGVEAEEEVASYGRDLARVETSLWKARQSSSFVEVVEEIVSYRDNLARVKASAW